MTAVSSCCPAVPNTTSFDYSALEPDVQRVIKDAAEEIRGAHDRHVEEALRMGRALIRVKDALPHGQFGNWLSTEFRCLSERTAQRYMTVAQVFGENPTHVSYLPLRLVQMLSSPSTPETTRNHVIERLDRGERPTEHEIVALIKIEKNERRREAIKTKEAADAKLKAARRQGRRDRLEKENQARAALEEKRRSAAREAAELIHDRLGDDFGILVRRLNETDGWWDLQRALQRLAGDGS
jgi:Protein of unknown function (DUF3102)